MSVARDGQPPDPSRLAAHEGRVLLTAIETVLKGVLESEAEASVLATPRAGVFGEVFRTAQEDGVTRLLTRHELELAAVPDASRAVTAALHAARSGGGALALVPNDQLPSARESLVAAAGETLTRGARLCLLLEDAPQDVPDVSPRTIIPQLGLACIEPATLEELRDAVELALRLSRTGAQAVGLIVHDSLLRSAATIEVRPNRVIDSVDAMLARRRGRRRPRVSEAADTLRFVRRLELNRATGLPSPGERTPVGFVTVGPAHAALQHVISSLGLAGRVASLQLGAVNPLDEPAVVRLLERCEHVLVLEPRPGEIETRVLAIAEATRRRGAKPGLVWGQTLPAGDGESASSTLGVDEAVHPSLLARRIIHVLHRLRPTGRVAGRLVPDPPRLVSDLPARDAGFGAAAAAVFIRRVLVDVDQWLRDRTEDERGTPVPRTVLAVDGARPETMADRETIVEVWDASAFLRGGVAAVRHAAAATQPWIIIVLDVGGANGVDLNRVAQAAVPGAHADRVTIETAIATERVLLTERLRDAALADGVTVVVVRDGTPGHFDLAAMERWVAEVDRLGFEPRQRVTWPIERCCALRPAAGPVGIKPDGRDEPTMEHAFRVERVTGARVSGVRFHARPLFERMEVMRTRPPARRWQRGPTGRLPLPEVIHRTSPWWRAHIAGYGGAGPGRAAEVLMRAGRHMGYAVNGQWNPEPIAHGRRAWAQVLFTRPRENEAPLPLTVRVPFGEADLLLGIEGTETLRALEGDATLRVAFAERSYAVVNAGGFGDEGDVTAASEREPALRQAVRACSRAQPRLLENVAEACRAWLHTARAVDLALVGAAFQLGLMPLTLDALQQAVAEIEHAGAGRAVDAFQFGRHLAVDARLFNRPREREEDLSGLVRRFSHQIARRRRDRPVAGRFRALARWTIEAMPGLAETDPGRAALRDFVVATYHCLQWGGLDYAERYATLITDLYRGDRGAAGRSLTRAAVLPLASAMLIRDPIYVGTMTASAEQRRRIRQMLNIKRARADEMERRYLTRFELRTGMRRYQLDLRTSDWPARLLSSLRRIVPESWRGSRRERELRSSMIGLVQRVTANASADYERFQRTLLHLHERAANDHLQDMSPSELRVMVDAEAGGELESDTRS